MSYSTGRAVLRVCTAGRLFLIVIGAFALWPTVAGAQTLPAGWTHTDVGRPHVSGSASGSGSTITVIGSGIEIGGTADQFTFVYRQVSGDVDVIARVASQQASSTWSKSGVMVRASLGGSAAHAVMYAKTAGQLAFRRRPTTGYSTIHTDAGPGYAPVWVKLERRGTAITAFRSADGVTWKMTGSVALSLPTTFYVGLVTTSGSKSTKATTQFTNVTVRAPGAAVNTPPTVSLWSPTDGATFTAPTIVNLAATANDADSGVALVEFYANNTLVGTDSASPYTYAWTPATGTYSVKAVARDTAGALATSAPRNITVNGVTTNTPPTVSLTAPAAGSTYVAPASVTITANAADANGSVARVDFYVGPTLVGSDTTSPYGVTWSNAPAGLYSLTAVARDNAGATTTSASRGITVNAASANTPPTVSLTAPAAGSSYIAPASVTIAANAADANGTIARVDFYAGSTLVGSDTSSPYSVTWSNAPAGSFSLTAVARDNAGATTTSAARGIMISNPSLPKRAIFVPSPDHATVTRYVLDVFTAGANPATALPIGAQDLGKPAIVNGECNVDVAATISGLPGGNYFATVMAVSPGGTSARTTSLVFAR
jgi:regulation of enolase protein 1 (concanavalin A-like superfamily)